MQAETEPLLPQQNVDRETRLHRSLSARQVQTIALGGAIGTGLFLGTGRSLAAGGPGTMLACYGLTGFIV
jgi:amino acid transporter, AAT family